MLEDLKFAWRRLIHAPGFTSVAVLTLALAIGANTAIFSVADAVLFRPLPYTDQDRLFILQMLSHKTGKQSTMIPNQYVQAIDDFHRGFSDVALVEGGPSIINPGTDGVERILTAVATPNYFGILGIRPALGRILDSRDAAQPGRAAMLSYSSWKQRFGGDRNIVGRSITLGTASFEIVGVLPAGFVFPSLFVTKPEIVSIEPPPRRGAAGGTFHPVVRLNPGVTRDQAQAEIEAVSASLPGLPEGYSDGNVTPVLDDVKSVLYPVGRPVMALLLACSALVLLIGCANLGIMLLARGQKGARDTGVRAALGASRRHLVLPVIFEAAIIGLAGSVLAVGVTSATFNTLLRQVPTAAYGSASVGVDLRVALYALGLGLAGALVFAAVPAWRSTRLDVQALIQGRQERIVRRGRLGGPLVAIQVALAVVLVFGAVTVGRAFMSVLNAPLGFKPENVIVLRFGQTGKTGIALQDFFVRVMQTLSQRGDVISVGATGSLPLAGSGPDEGARIPGASRPSAGLVHILPGYFEAAGLQLLRGRLLDWSDVHPGADAAVVGESAARALFPGREALGGTFENQNGRQFRVVGVVADVAAQSFSPPTYAIPEDAAHAFTLVVHMRTHQDATLVAIKREAGSLAPGTLVLADWWTDMIGGLTTYRNPRFQTIVLGMFAALALGLTALGIFGVVAFAVAMRTHEMGIRLAIGAVPRSLVGLMVRQALAPVSVGLAAGLLTTRWAGRLAEAQLFHVRAGDPVTLAAAAATVAAAALLAAYVPARRASRVDPMTVLRGE